MADPLPSRIGPYVIEALLGQGASSVVYRARHVELDRPVALKVLHAAAGAAPHLVERLAREARAVAKLSHPNVVAVHDAGRADGVPFIAMALVEGQPLGVAIERGHLSLRQRVALLAKAAEAVEHAHRHGILHRDLKPGNIIVDKDAEPHVVDFGLAYVGEAGASLTQSGMTVGTPLYMSPEQIRGERETLGRPSDVYSLGVILYELLTGRLPHGGARVEEVYLRILTTDPAPPRRLNPQIPRDLEIVCLRAIDREPAVRYATAADLAADLRRWLAGEPVTARPPSTFRRAWRSAGARRAVLAAAALALAGTGAWIAAGSMRRSERRADAAQRERDRLAEATSLLERARPAIDDAFAAFYDAEARPAELRERVAQAEKLVDQAVARAPALAAAHFLKGRARELGGDWDGAERAAREALRLDARFGPAHYQLGRLLVTRAFVAQIDFGRADEASRTEAGTRLLEEAVRELDAAIAAGSGFDDELQRVVAEAMRAVARRDFDEAGRLAGAGAERFGARRGVEDLHWVVGLTVASEEERRGAYDKALQRRPWHAMVLFCRANQRRTTDPDGAIEDYSRAIEAHPRFGVALNNRGTARADRGDLRGAVEDFTRSLELEPRHAPALTNRGSVREQQGDLDGASDDYTRALEIEPRSAATWSNRASLRLKRGDLDGALADANRAVETDPALPHGWANRGRICRLRGELDRALEDLDQAVKLDPHVPHVYVSRALVHEQRNDLDRALADLTRAIEVSPRYARAWSNRGHIRCVRGEYARAIEDCDRAIALDGSHAEAYMHRANARTGLHDGEGAIRDYTAALEHGPQLLEARLGRALVYRDLGDAARAREDLERIVASAPKDWPHRERASRALAELRRE